MSRKTTKSVGCPRCGQHSDAQMYSTVNVTLEPKLRARIMEESLFAWRCPHCGFDASLLYPCLYHDMEQKFMIYLLPGIKDRVLPDDDAETRFPELGDLKKRLAPDLNTLKEKIMIFEAGLDDRAVELAKLALSRALSKRLHSSIQCGYFCLLDREHNQVGFSFFLPRNKEPVFESTKIEVYDRSLDIARRFGGIIPPGFLTIDAAWADKVLRDYHASMA